MSALWSKLVLPAERAKPRMSLPRPLWSVWQSSHGLPTPWATRARPCARCCRSPMRLVAREALVLRQRRASRRGSPGSGPCCRCARATCASGPGLDEKKSARAVARRSGARDGGAQLTAESPEHAVSSPKLTRDRDVSSRRYGCVAMIVSMTAIGTWTAFHWRKSGSRRGNSTRRRSRSASSQRQLHALCAAPCARRVPRTAVFSAVERADAAAAHDVVLAHHRNVHSAPKKVGVPSFHRAVIEVG